MPSYRFHTTDAACGRHEHVCELPDIRTAKSTATVLAGDILREIHEHLYEKDLRIIVTDGDGQLCWDIRVTGIEGPGASESP